MERDFLELAATVFLKKVSGHFYKQRKGRAELQIIYYLAICLKSGHRSQALRIPIENTEPVTYDLLKY